MKKAILLCVFMMIAATGVGQTKDSIVVSIDTINIKGIIRGYDGKPVKNILIGLRGPSAPHYSTIVKTDSSGCFKFNGANPSDKLFIIDGRYTNMYFPISGSRYLVIYLPPPKIFELNPEDSILVKARRKYPGIKPTFRVANDLIYGDGSEYLPQPAGGVEKLITYIRENLVYPEKAIVNNIEGTVEVIFKVTKDGSLTDITVVKGIGYGCDDEVVQLIKKSPNWHPGIMIGRPLETLESVAIKFLLTDR